MFHNTSTNCILQSTGSTESAIRPIRPQIKAFCTRKNVSKTPEESVKNERNDPAIQFLCIGSRRVARAPQIGMHRPRIAMYNTRLMHFWLYNKSVCYPSHALRGATFRARSRSSRMGPLQTFANELVAYLINLFTLESFARHLAAFFPRFLFRFSLPLTACRSFHMLLCYYFQLNRPIVWLNCIHLHIMVRESVIDHWYTQRSPSRRL